MLVWCLVIDHGRTILGDAFTVDCDPGLDVDGLTTEVVASRYELKRIPNAFVFVYHNSAIRADMNGDELKSAILQLDLAQAEVKSSKLVTEVASGSELMIIQKPAPRELYAVNGSILKLTQAGAFRKRARSPTPEIDHFSRLKSSKILQGTPSEVAQFSQYKAMQYDRSERLLDDRPRPEQGIAPISLLYGPFGEFDDIFHRRTPPPTDINIDLPHMEYGVDELATAMSRRYTTDDEQRSAGEKFIREMFPFRLRGCESETHGLLTTIAKFKVMLPDSPYVESVARIAQSHASSDAFKDVCGRWRVPALVIAMDGFKATFYAVILLGHQYRVTSLTPGLSWSREATNGADRQSLHNAFIAAHVLQLRINRDLYLYMERPELLPPVLSSRERFFPAVSKIRAHGPNAKANEYVEFQIVDDFCPEGNERYLYYAKVTAGAPALSGQDRHVCVKFTKQYSIELHDFCAERGHAPKVFGYERLPGGWFAIAMEFIDGALPIQPDTYSSEKEKQLFGLVKEFHEKGLVHGDLRSVNIICKDSSDKCWLVDFDLGGKEGEAEYSLWNLSEEQRSGRQWHDVKIRKEDDLRILRASLANLEQQKSK